MKNLTDNPIDEIIKKLSENMQGYDTFFEYKENLIDVLLEREPNIVFNPFENTNPY